MVVSSLEPSSGASSSLFILFKMMWRVAEPNEALIISGLRQHTPTDACRRASGSRSSPARARW